MYPIFKIEDLVVVLPSAHAERAGELLDEEWIFLIANTDLAVMSSQRLLHDARLEPTVVIQIQGDELQEAMDELIAAERPDGTEVIWDNLSLFNEEPDEEPAQIEPRTIVWPRAA